MATRRKFGAIRYGVLLAALAAADQTIPVEPLVISVSLGQADAPTPGTSIRAVPYQRPIFQRTIRGYGFLAGASTSDASLSASPLTTTVSLPTAAASAGGVTVGTTPLIATVSLPTAAAAGSVSLSPGALVTAVSLPTAAAASGISLSAGTLGTTVSLPTATASPGAASLSSGTLGATVSLPTATAAAGGVSVATSPLVAAVLLPTATLVDGSVGVSIPIHVRRAVGQRGYRYYGPPSYSTTPESDRTLSTDPLVVAVSLPTATASASGDPRLPAPFLRIRTVKPYLVNWRPYVAAYGVVEELAPEDRTLTTTPLSVAVSLPTATAASTTLEPSLPELKRTRLVRQRPFTEPRTTPLVARHGYLKPPDPGTAQGLAVSTLGLSVSLPTATVSAGAATVSSAPLVATVSLPTAISTRAVTVTAIGTSVSLPTATLSAGAAPVTTAPLVVTVSLPAPRVLGATTLPDIVRTTLESRMAERILTDRRGKRLVDHRNGDKTVEYNG